MQQELNAGVEEMNSPVQDQPLVNGETNSHANSPPSASTKLRTKEKGLHSVDDDGIVDGDTDEDDYSDLVLAALALGSFSWLMSSIMSVFD